MIPLAPGWPHLCTCLRTILNDLLLDSINLCKLPLLFTCRFRRRTTLSASSCMSKRNSSTRRGKTSTPNDWAAHRRRLPLGHPVPVCDRLFCGRLRRLPLCSCSRKAVPIERPRYLDSDKISMDNVDHEGI
jgi:hypothetical protein